MSATPEPDSTSPAQEDLDRDQAIADLSQAVADRDQQVSDLEQDRTDRQRSELDGPPEGDRAAGSGAATTKRRDLLSSERIAAGPSDSGT